MWELIDSLSQDKVAGLFTNIRDCPNIRWPENCLDDSNPGGNDDQLCLLDTGYITFILSCYT